MPGTAGGMSRGRQSQGDSGIYCFVPLNHTQVAVAPVLLLVRQHAERLCTAAPSVQARFAMPHLMATTVMQHYCPMCLQSYRPGLVIGSPSFMWW